MTNSNSIAVSDKNAVPETTVVFNTSQMGVLNVLLDLLIPASPDGRMPAARSLDLFVDLRHLPVKDYMLFESGLSELEARARQDHGTGFAQLPIGEAQILVDALRSDAAAFIKSFTTQAVGRYLAHEVVMPLIGLEARPHWPTGHTVNDGDWSLLDVVKQRPKLYRIIPVTGSKFS
jgi:hypothetical protein